MIVSSLPRTGSALGQTDHIVLGIRMAIADFEKDFPFEIKYRDMDDATADSGDWDAAKEADNARTAAEDRDVMAYIGPYNSGAAKVSIPILNEQPLVQVSPACTWPGLTRKVKGDERSGEPGIYRRSGKITFCRVCPHDDSQGPFTAIFIAKHLKARSVCIIDDKELYGGGVAHRVEAKCKDLGVKVLDRGSINFAAPNYKALVQAVKKAAPDAVFFGGTTQSGGPHLAIELKAAGVTCPLIVPDGCYEEAFIKAAGEEAVNGRCYATIGGVDPSQLKGAGADFVKRFKEEYHREPEAYAAYGYEAVAVVLAAIKAVGKKDREAIRKAVLATKDFDEGVLGKWSFDENGDTTLQQVSVSKIEKGKFVPVTVITGEK